MKHHIPRLIPRHQPFPALGHYFFSPFLGVVGELAVAHHVLVETADALGGGEVAGRGEEGAFEGFSEGSGVGEVG